MCSSGANGGKPPRECFVVQLEKAMVEWQRCKQTLPLTSVPNAHNMNAILVTAQKPRPVAVCTRCRAVSYSANLINGRCGQMAGNKQCIGVIGNAMNDTDWDECPACAGSGMKGATRCGRCDGSGWLHIRDRHR
jgi:hypothetical protein